MLSDLNKPQKIFMIILYILTIVATVMGVFAIYNISNIKKPWTLGVTYASVLETKEGQKDIISIEINENNNNNGIPVYDMRINSYADHEGNGLIGFGIQCVGDWKIINKSDYEVFSSSPLVAMNIAKEGNQMKIRKEEIEQYKSQYANMFEVNETIAFGDFYFYKTGNDGKVYSMTGVENMNKDMLIDIDGAYYRLSLKSYEYESLTDNAWSILIGDISETKTSSYTWFEIFDLAMKSAKYTNVEDKYSKFALPLQDLSDFVTLQYQDKDTQYKELPKTTENRNYFTLQVEFDNNGATKSSDSIFGMIYGSGNYDYYADTTVNDYWNAYSELTITESNINFVYNADLEAYYVTISEQFASYLSTLTHAEISINLDLTQTDINVYGIDLQNFDFDIKEFDIKVNSVENFKVYNQELCSVTPTLSEV